MDKQHLASTVTGMITGLTAWFTLPDPHALILAGLKIAGTLVPCGRYGLSVCMGTLYFQANQNEMEKITGLVLAAITANLDFIAVILVLLGGIFAKHYMTWWKAPTALKTLVMGTLFLVIWCVIQHGADKLNADGLGKMFFSYCVATSLYELILRYVFDWLAKKGINLSTTIVLMAVALTLPGCMTQRRVTRYLNEHAFTAASYCASAFPVRDSVVRVVGKQVLLPGDTVLIPGQTFPCPALPAAQEVTCPDSRLIRDTLLRTDTLTLWRENTAKTAAMRGELAQLRADSTRAILTQAKATKRGWLMWGTWIVLALILSGWLFVRSRTALLTSAISALRGKL